MQNTVIIIQARLGSTRLPGKVLKHVNGIPLIKRVFDRCLQVKKASKVVIATTENTLDDPLEEFCNENDILVFRGSEEDVLDRYFQVGTKLKATAIVRVTGDCPLIDPVEIDKLIEKFNEGKWDYISNSMPLKLPHGLEASIGSFEAFKKSWEKANLSSEREHVTHYIRTHPKLFTIGGVEYQSNYSHLRLTVDYQEDYDAINQLYKILEERGLFGHYMEVVKILEEFPEIAKINAKFKIGEGLKKSIENDKTVSN
ncbi:cytidylyltransferase domain-containing protein [Flexithrix dorotheae]|uniref:cytidylyltransferase domain-containing protein n=1 Tax=Flexithrix dorotheae TaxID=70993 RepID=UPI0003613A28|nr:glycosyltransferase family protein [Flexithrix dorotheae]